MNLVTYCTTMDQCAIVSGYFDNYCAVIAGYDSAKAS